MNPQILRPLYTKKHISLRVIGILLSVLLLVTGAVILSPVTAAQAATGTVNDPSIKIVHDGASGIGGDISTTDGLVGIGGTVAFGWAVTISDLQDGVLTQTLPKGWSWNTGSLDTSGMSNPNGLNGYTSTYALSNDMRTLTLNISVSGSSGGTQLIEFNSPTATVSHSAAKGTPYAPVLEVTDGGGVRQIAVSGAPATLEVVSTVEADIRKGARTGGNGEPGTYDFGNGPEDAVRQTFYVELWRNQHPGRDIFQWKGPITVSDTFTLTHDGQSAMNSKQAVSLGNNSGGGLAVSLANVDAAAGTFDVVFDSIPDRQSVWTNVDIWIPRSEVPNVAGQGTFPIVMSNSISKPANANWETTDGKPLSDSNPGNNQAVGNYGIIAPLPGKVSEEFWNNLTSVDTNSFVNGWGSLPGAEYRAALHYLPALDRPVGQAEWDPTPVTGLNLVERWNPDDATLLPSEGWVNVWDTGNTGKLVKQVEGTDYRVYYTTDPTSVTNPTWVERSAYSGSIDAVSGIRYEYIGNGGVYKPASANLSRDQFAWVARPAFVIKRGLPDAANPQDLGRIVHSGSGFSSSWPRMGPVDRDLYVRAGGASITNKGVALDKNGDVVKPERTSIVAGDAVRYTIDPALTGISAQLTPPGGIPAGLKVKNVVVQECLPANLLLDTIKFRGDTLDKWNYDITSTICGQGQRLITFKYKSDANYADDLGVIEFDVRSSSVAPYGSGFLNWASVGGNGINGANGIAASAENWMYASQLNVARQEKTTSTPMIERGEKAKYQVKWMNFLSATRQKSTFVDVLPYNGDSRGTRVSGPVTLVSADLSANARTNAELQITTDAAIRTNSAAPADGVAWIAYASATPDQIAEAKALRVVVADFVPGSDSLGELNYELDVPEGRNGEELQNTVTGSLMNGTVLLQESPASGVKIQSSDISGMIWNDEDGNGKRDSGETPIANAKIELLSGATVVANSQTDSKGKYTLSGLVSGDYTLRVDGASLPATSGQWLNTSAPSSGSQGVSGVITLAAAESLADQDFGYRDNVPAILIEKTGTAPSNIAKGELVTWNYKVTNKGNVPLASVQVTDDLQGIGALKFGAWPDVTKQGTLEPGESITATATSPLTQAQINVGKVESTAKATGASDVPQTTVESSASAAVTLAGSSTMSLDKSAVITRGGQTVLPSDAKAGDTVTYSFRVTNGGNQTLTDVSVADKLPGLSAISYAAWPTAKDTLEPGEEVTGTATLTLTQEHIDEGTLVNKARAEAKTPDNKTLGDDGSVTLSFTNQPLVSVSTTAAVDPGLPTPGKQITYTFLVKNEGSSKLTDVQVSGKLDGLSAVTFSSWPKANGVLLPGESVTATATLKLTQEHIDAGKVSNSVSVSAAGPTKVNTRAAGGVLVKASDNIDVMLQQAPDISLNIKGALEPDVSGISYSFTLKNVGNTTLEKVGINEKLRGVSDIEYSWKGQQGVLAPGQTVTARATFAIASGHRGTTVVNEAIGSGRSPLGAVASSAASSHVEVPVLKQQKPKSGGLAVTGGSALAGVGVLAVMLLAAGVTLMRRRRSA